MNENTETEEQAKIESFMGQEAATEPVPTTKPGVKTESKNLKYDSVKVGSLWVKENEYGKFLSGEISKKDLPSHDRVFIYLKKVAPGSKKNANSPDIIIYARTKDRGQDQDIPI